MPPLGRDGGGAASQILNLTEKQSFSAHRAAKPTYRIPSIIKSRYLRPMERDRESGAVKRCSFDTVNDRQLYLLDLNEPAEIPATYDLCSPNFGCLLVWDASRSNTQEVISVVQPLIDAGCVYFCCWGPSCEWVHDTIDTCDPYLETTAAVIMTTWHEHDPIEEAVWFFLNTMWPDPAFENSFRSSIAVIIGSKDWATTVRTALQQPEKFTKAWLDREDSADSTS